MTPISSKLKSLLRTEQGNLTLLVALSAAPLVGCAGLAIDYLRIVEARSDVQAVADGAALAAAAATGSDTQKQQIALAYANKNLKYLYGVTAIPSASVSGSDVTVSVATTVKGTLLAVMFPDGDGSSSKLPSVNFTVSSKANKVAGSSYYSCIIALNASMANAVYIRGTGDFTATNCTVRSNSASSTGMTFQGNANSTAQNFLSAGGYQKIGNSGSLTPTPKTSQGSVTDPISMAVTDPGGTASTATIKKQDGNVSLSAAKYSNITIQAQGTATFTAGTHYITGTLSLGSQATLSGTGVTLILLGSNAKIDMNSGGTLKLQAPTSGTYGGYAVIGDKSATTVQTNTIQGGSAGYVRGIWYTPKHKFYVTGNGDFNSTSTYFALIADNIEIGGNGYFKTGVTYNDYSMPNPTALKVSTSQKVKLTN